MEPAACVLLADDVEANVELLEDQLAPLGLRTLRAVDAPSALALATERRPDLCILDVSMPAGALGVPDRDAGFEVCRRLKRDPRTARIPVIFVSALNDPADRLKAIECGGDDFLVKPQNRHVLGARVRSLLKLKGATDALEESLRRLREMQKARDDLTRMVVHDLKTPLTSMLATLEMLRDGDFGNVNERAARALSDVEGKAEDLLAPHPQPAGRPRRGHNRWRWRRSRSHPLRSWPSSRSIGRYDSARSRPPPAPRSPTTRRSSRPTNAILKRVFSNLIQNAITHSPMPVTLTLGARRDGRDSLHRGDDGPGIPEEFQETIFATFAQLERAERATRFSEQRARAGVLPGGGRAHGGRIWVRSAEGQGAPSTSGCPWAAA
jgi:two-component system, sensor histidine kinase and response regulator